MTILNKLLDTKLGKIQEFCKLNADITYLIIPYTYSYQSKDLLNDIKSYVYTLNIVNDYYDRWFVSPSIRAHSFWFNNYLWWYLREGLTREDHMILLKYKSLKISQLYSRLYKFLNAENLNAENLLFQSYVTKRVNKLRNSNIITKNLILDNRIIWGLLKPSQREWFIKDTCKYL
jgi:hypothetical protein